MSTFGDKIRRYRELRGISLDAISNTTKISTRMLRAIEDEHFDQLPGGVFNKGFVRAYARQVGLDEEEAVSDYLAALRESQIQSQTILPNLRTPAAKPTTEAHLPDPRNPARKDDVRNNGHHPDAGDPAPYADGLYGNPAESRAVERRLEVRRREARRSEDREGGPNEAIASVAQRQEGHPKDRPGDIPSSSPLSFLHLDSAHPASHPEPSAVDSDATLAPAANDSSRRVPWEKLAAALLLITLTLALWTLRGRNRPAGVSQAAASSGPSGAPAAPVSTLASTEPLAANSPAAGHSSASIISANQSAAIPSDPDVNPPVSKPNAHITTHKPPPSFTLLIRADQTSWVAITADGQSMERETLIAPANTSVRASHEIVVKAGNAAGISFLLNGKEIPVSGNPGEVRTYTFDATGLQSSTTMQPTNTTR